MSVFQASRFRSATRLEGRHVAMRTLAVRVPEAAGREFDVQSNGPLTPSGQIGLLKGGLPSPVSSGKTLSSSLDGGHGAIVEFKPRNEPRPRRTSVRRRER